MNNITQVQDEVLAIFLQNTDLLNETYLKPEHFTNGPRRVLFSRMLKLNDEGAPVDLVTLTANQEEVGQFGGIAYLADLSGAFVQPRKLEHYGDLIVEEFKKHETVQLGIQLSHGMDPDVAAERFRDLQDIGAKDSDGSIKMALVEMYDAISSATGKISGIRSGFRDLDEMTQGFQNEDFVVVGARPSVGKTAYAINIATNAALHPVHRPEGAGVCIFSLEMPKRNLLRRMAGSTQNIDLHVLRKGAPFMQDADWKKLTIAMGELASSELFIHDAPAQDLKYIFKNARKTKAEFNRKHPGAPFLIIIDYLQLIIGDGKYGGNRQQEISDISRGLKRLARELKCPVIALSQLSRSLEQRQDKRPMMSDLRESGQIEQDADLIQFLYRDDYYDKESENQNMIEIITAKQREGSTGTTTLAFVKEYGKFLSIAWSQGEYNAAADEKAYQ